MITAGLGKHTSAQKHGALPERQHARRLMQAIDAVAPASSVVDAAVLAAARLAVVNRNVLQLAHAVDGLRAASQRDHGWKPPHLVSVHWLYGMVQGLHGGAAAEAAAAAVLRAAAAGEAGGRTPPVNGGSAGATRRCSAQDAAAAEAAREDAADEAAAAAVEGARTALARQYLVNGNLLRLGAMLHLLFGTGDECVLEPLARLRAPSRADDAIRQQRTLARNIARIGDVVRRLLRGNGSTGAPPAAAEAQQQQQQQQQQMPEERRASTALGSDGRYVVLHAPGEEKLDGHRACVLGELGGGRAGATSAWIEVRVASGGCAGETMRWPSAGLRELEGSPAGAGGWTQVVERQAVLNGNLVLLAGWVAGLSPPRDAGAHRDEAGAICNLWSEAACEHLQLRVGRNAYNARPRPWSPVHWCWRSLQQCCGLLRQRWRGWHCAGQRRGWRCARATRVATAAHSES